MSLILKNVSLLLGKDLTFVADGYLEIGKDGIIKKAKRGLYDRGNDKKAHNNTIFDAEGFLLIPGLINAHTHIGDSLGKDVAVDSGLDARVHPIHGAKQKILQSKPDHLRTFIRSSVLSMMKKGITTFADFREGGAEGVKLLREAISGLPIKCVIFGRAEYYIDITSSATGTSQRNLPSSASQMTSEVLEVSDGLGISGANENSDEALQQYRNLVRIWNENATKDKKKLLTAIHAAESENTVKFSKSYTGTTEVARIMKCLRPDIIIHMTHASEKDISMVARNQTGVVVCPRANGVIGAGAPRVAKMLDLGCIIGIGSDNVMLNSPDILRELDYIWKVSRSIEPNFLRAKDILKMATVNNAEILRLNSGYIHPGRSADIIFIDKSHLDLYPIHDPFATIVQRTTEASIKAVMIDGRFVDGAQFEFANNN